MIILNKVFSNKSFYLRKYKNYPGTKRQSVIKYRCPSLSPIPTMLVIDIYYLIHETVVYVCACAYVCVCVCMSVSMYLVYVCM